MSHTLVDSNILRRDIIEIIRQKDSQSELTSVINLLHGDNYLDHDENYLQIVKREFNRLKSEYNEKWKLHHRVTHVFEQKEAEWLSRPFRIPQFSLSTNKGGRPTKLFDDKCVRSQLRDITAVSDSQEPQVKKLMLATARTAKKFGESSVSELLKIASASPSKPKQFLEAINNPLPKQYTPDEALSLIIDLDLTKHAYEGLRQGAIDHSVNLYPPYNHVREVKAKCRPDGIQVTETKAFAPLQNILNHTAMRILKLQEEVLHSFIENHTNQNLSLLLICSWGLDSSTGHSNYKQVNVSSSVNLDSSLLVSSLIPLQLLHTATHAVLWHNPSPQSIRYCRPMKIEFTKETPEKILEERDYFDKQIRKLLSYNYSLTGEIVFTVSFQMHLTLIDGKVLNVLTNTTSNSSCPLCHATQKQFNSALNSPFFKVNDSALQFGLSPLHAWIRCFEFLLHLSYRLQVKCWQVKGEEGKQSLQLRKYQIQSRFRQSLGLLVDIPKVGGSGNTNDGNTARIAFRNPEKLAEILEIEISIVKGFHVILVALSCQLPIDPLSFSSYCQSLFSTYMRYYSWNPITPTVHKILVHGHEIIEKTMLPLGVMGEDASESRHRIYKHDRYHHSRKGNRIQNLTDMFCRALDSSDPFVSGLSAGKRLKARKRIKLPAEVIALLKAPVQINCQSEENNNNYTLTSSVKDIEETIDSFTFIDGNCDTGNHDLDITL